MATRAVMSFYSVRNNALATAALLTLNRVNAHAQGIQERVNTGLAVGSAKKDAATFAISMGMRSQIAELGAVRQNIASAKSIVSVAHAGAEQMKTLLDEAMVKRVKLESEESAATIEVLSRNILALLDQAETAADAASLNGVNLLKGDTTEVYTGRNGLGIGLGGMDLTLDSLNLSQAAGAAAFGPEALRDEAPIGSSGTPVTTFAVGGGDPDDVQMLVDGRKWGGAVGTGVNLSYSFYEAGVSQYNYGGEIDDNPYELSDSLKNSVRAALDTWAAVSGITFTEVADTPTTAGELRFGGSGMPPTAWAYYPSSQAAGGDVWFGDYFRTSDASAGTYTYLTAIHEIGHALGLKHPHPGPYEGTEHDQLQWSVMSYKDFEGEGNNGYQHDPYPITPMIADVTAIQYLYGANNTHASGDTTYQWGVGAEILETIWDSGGTDTIDWSNQSADSTIDLRDGYFSDMGPAVWAHGQWLYDTVGIAVGAVIENANGGSGIDQITGNDADNVITGNGDNDVIDGGVGNDTAVFSGNYADYTFSQSGSDIYVNGPDGNDTLRNIENLQFDDQTVLATDLVFGGDPPPPPPPPPEDPPEPPDLPELPTEDGDSLEVPTVEALDQALATVRTALAQLGAQSRTLESRASFAEDLIDSLKTGLGVMVDADMAVESARLQAAQTQQQLALEALAMANAQPKAILQLFQT